MDCNKICHGGSLGISVDLITFWEELFKNKMADGGYLKKSRGRGYCHHLVWPSGCASVFRFQSISWRLLAGLFSCCIHTPHSTFDFEAIIDFNWWREISFNLSDCVKTYPCTCTICLEMSVVLSQLAFFAPGALMSTTVVFLCFY